MMLVLRIALKLILPVSLAAGTILLTVLGVIAAAGAEEFSTMGSLATVTGIILVELVVLTPIVAITWELMEDDFKEFGRDMRRRKQARIAAREAAKTPKAEEHDWIFEVHDVDFTPAAPGTQATYRAWCRKTMKRAIVCVGFGTFFWYRPTTTTRREYAQSRIRVDGSLNLSYDCYVVWLEVDAMDRHLAAEEEERRRIAEIRERTAEDLRVMRESWAEIDRTLGKGD